ncbi:MAG: NYN domain-containing protein [Anaerolinea sp.]|nr:NYN domain-containing protein [Anaerolinea sp.]
MTELYLDKLTGVQLMHQCVILVDNSNIFIEGQKFSARQKGVFKSSPTDKSPQDPAWRINFEQLILSLANGRKIHAAILVGSRPPKNDSVWDAAKQGGFEVIVHDRDSSNKEKAVDTELVAQGVKIILKAPEPMVLIIASGDRDFIPLVKTAQEEQWEVEMWAFSSSFSLTGEMATSVDRTMPLDQQFETIGKYDFEWPIP